MLGLVIFEANEDESRLYLSVGQPVAYNLLKSLQYIVLIKWYRQLIFSESLFWRGISCF